MAEARIVKAVQAVIRGCGEATPFFVATACTRVKLLDALVDGPFDRGVVAGIEVEAVNILNAAPIAPIKAIAFGQAEGKTNGLIGIVCFVIGGNQENPMLIVRIELLKETAGEVFAAPEELIAGAAIEGIDLGK